MSRDDGGMTLHEASVPVFTRYLRQLDGLVDRARRHVDEQGIDADAILQARLAPDMLPFSLQVDIAAQFTLRACAPLAGIDVPPFGETSRSFAELSARIARTVEVLGGITPESMLGADTRTFTSQAGDALVSLPGREFLLHYTLPNFFFHLCAAYAILRQQGVAVGKSDFDGLHAY